MIDRNTNLKFTELNPKQPEFVLITSDYTKKYLMKYDLAHFYQFTAEANHMGVIPDASVDILFWKKDGRVKSKIAGTLLEKGAAALEEKCEYFGVRFMPGYNPVSSSIKLSELVNHEMVFEDLLVSDDAKKYLFENLYYSESFEEKIFAFMKYYIKQYENQMDDKYSLRSALIKEIIRSNGDLKLSALSIFTGYSERYLNRKIHEEFGMNPKKLIRFIRFQKAVSNLIASMDCINCTNTALEAGYFDQSHLIKEFKLLSGLTPVNYIDNLLGNSYVKKLHILY